jgi:hypothetical protein
LPLAGENTQFPEMKNAHRHGTRGLTVEDHWIFFESGHFRQLGFGQVTEFLHSEGDVDEIKLIQSRFFCQTEATFAKDFHRLENPNEFHMNILEI